MRPSKSHPVKVNLVEVVELNPPPDEPPVRWVLVTSEPVETVEQILQVVDWYRARWQIEEWFKSLKTGCSYETRQLESASTLLTTLAILIPIAWRLLFLRALERTASDAPAATVVTDLELKILRRATPKRKWRDEATVADVCEALAQLGGHIRQNGPPGWLVLGRGLSKLLTLTEGARLLADL